MSFNSLLCERCTIRRKTETQSARGALNTSWANATSGVSCAIQPGSSSEAIQRMKEGATTTMDLYVPTGTSLLRTDRIIMEGGDYSGRTFSVTGFPLGMARGGVGLRAVIEEASDGGTS